MQISTLLTPLALLGAVYAQGTSTVGKDGLTTSWTTITSTQTTTVTSTVLSNSTAPVNNTLPSSTQSGPARYSPTLPITTAPPTAAAVPGDATSNFHAGAAAAVGLAGAVAALFL